MTGTLLMTSKMETWTKTHPHQATLLSDDDASDLILLNDLEIQTLSDPINRPENLIQERMDIKQETPKQIETNIEKEEEAYHAIIDLDS